VTVEKKRKEQYKKSLLLKSATKVMDVVPPITQEDEPYMLQQSQYTQSADITLLMNRQINYVTVNNSAANTIPSNDKSSRLVIVGCENDLVELGIATTNNNIINSSTAIINNDTVAMSVDNEYTDFIEDEEFDELLNDPLFNDFLEYVMPSEEQLASSTDVGCIPIQSLTAADYSPYVSEVDEEENNNKEATTTIQS